MKTAILVQAHANLDYIKKLAGLNTGTNFYIHYDKKQIQPKIELTNVYFVSESVAVYWGGFSQVEATLKLLKLALENDDNEYFHLISAEDVLLRNIKEIEQEWDVYGKKVVFIESYNEKNRGYQVRFNAWHADTIYQRKFIGKVTTKIYQLLDKIFFTKNKVLTGSQWFSIRRDLLESILNSIDEDDLNYFRKKLVPDEHFFQFVFNKYGFNKNVLNDNKRYIIFSKYYNRGNNPCYLTQYELAEAKNKGFWFARKVNVQTQLEQLEE